MSEVNKGGRPPLPPGEKLLVVPVRLTAEQKAKFLRLGGAKWLRDRIDSARERATKE